MSFDMDMSTPDRRRIGRPFEERAHFWERASDISSLDLLRGAIAEARKDLAALERKAFLLDLRREATEEFIQVLLARQRTLERLDATLPKEAPQ